MEIERVADLEVAACHWRDGYAVVSRQSGIAVTDLVESGASNGSRRLVILKLKRCSLTCSPFSPSRGEGQDEG